MTYRRTEPEHAGCVDNTTHGYVDPDVLGKRMSTIRQPAATLRASIMEIRIEKLNELYEECIKEGDSPAEAHEYCSKKLKLIPSVTTSMPNKKTRARRGIRDPQELNDILDLPVRSIQVDHRHHRDGFIFTVRYRGRDRRYHMTHSLLAKLNHLEEQFNLTEMSNRELDRVRSTPLDRKCHYTEEKRRVTSNDDAQSRMRFNRRLHTRVDPNSNRHAVNREQSSYDAPKKRRPLTQGATPADSNSRVPGPIQRKRLLNRR